MSNKTTKHLVDKLTSYNINEALVIDELPKVNFGEIIQVGQDGLELLLLAEEVTVQDIEDDKMCAELNMSAKILSQNLTRIEKIRVDMKKPYLDNCTAIEDKFRLVKGKFSDVIGKIRTSVTKYETAKQANLKAAREEVEKKNRESLAKAAKQEAANKKNSLSHGGTGEVAPVIAEVVAAPIAKVSVSGSVLVKKWKAVVVDPTKVPARFLIAPGVIEAIRKEVQKEVNDNKKKLGRMASLEDATPIKGVAIELDASARF